MDNILMGARRILAVTPECWLNWVDLLPSELLAQRPAPGEWSAVECLVHILDTERWVFPVRVKAFLAGQDMPAFDPDTQGTRISDNLLSVRDLVNDFARLRTESLSLIDHLTPVDLKRQSTHAELGLVTLDQMMHEWAAHDLNHTIQGERAMMQPFIRGCGPWQPYFTDHVIKRSNSQQ